VYTESRETSVKYVYLVFFLAFCALVALFAGQNAAEVTVSFFSWSSTGSLSLYLILFLIVGLLLGILIMLPGIVTGSVNRFFAGRAIALGEGNAKKVKTSETEREKSAAVDKDS
jgi:uncharacterized integral membrane protein